MTVAVLVDDPVRPWQQAVVDALDAACPSVHVAATPAPGRRASAAVRLYGRLERWPSSRAAAAAFTELPSGAELVVDLTS